MNRSRETYYFVLTGAALWCILLFAAPLLRSIDFAASGILYNAFSRVCHQFPDRSFHVAGEPLAVCIRCCVLYVSFLASLILYPLVRRRLPVPGAKFLLVAFVPMALDVALNLSGLNVSTTWTRIITGSLAGMVLPFFILPPLQEAVFQWSAYFGESTHARKTR